MFRLSPAAVTEEANLYDRGELTRALDAGAYAWSNGDLDGFMQLYENSLSTTYISGGKIIQGYQMIRDAYASRFDDGEPMGRLTMAVQDYRSLGSSYALVIGRYSLQTPVEADDDGCGIFTLVLRRSAEAWRIISDQTS